MTVDSKKSPDATAAQRQQRRRQRLKELQARTVGVVLNKEQGQKLDSLLAAGYALDQSSVLVKGLDEAYEREIQSTRRTEDISGCADDK